MNRYISQQFRAIISMMRGEDWEAQLDMTTEGVFRSFWAIPLSLPLVVVSGFITLELLRMSPDYATLEIPDLPLAYEALLQSITFVVAWAVALLLLVGLSQQTGAGARVTPLIVSYNWSVLLMQLIGGAGVLIVALLQQPALLLLFWLALRVFWFFMRWCLIRQSLRSDIAPTIGIIILIFLASSLIGGILADLGQGIYETFWGAPAPSEGV